MARAAKRRRANMRQMCGRGLLNLDMQIPAIDVSEIMDAIGDIDGIQYDNLSAIFGGTWVEAHANQNKEW